MFGTLLILHTPNWESTFRPSILYVMGILATTPKATPPRNKALLRAYQPLVSLKKALLTPYSWGG